MTREDHERTLQKSTGKPSQPIDSTPSAPDEAFDNPHHGHDERVKNNVMRHEYRVLSEDEKLAMKDIKDDGLAFINYCDSLGQSRELSLAKTKIEEAVFWAVKHITA